MKKKTDEYRGRDMGSRMSTDSDMGAGGISLRRQVFSSLKNPVYRLYFGGMLGQMASMNMQMLARSLLIYRVTGSAAILGVMSLANALPMLFLSLFGGVIADRVQKKKVLIVGQASSAIVSLGVALALTLGYLSTEQTGSWWILIVASILQGTIMGLMMPSRQAIIPEIVSEEQVMNAIALNSMGMNALRLFAPAATGFLIDALDFAAVYYTMTGMYLMAVVFISFMPPTGTITIRGGGALDDIRDGIDYIRHETTILLLLAFTLVIVVLSMPYIMLMPIFADDILKVGATGLGIMMSVSGVGAVVGSLVLASLPNKKRGAILLVTSLIMGVALAGFSFSKLWPLSLVLIAFVGLGQTGRMALANTLLQQYTEEQYRGRVMSFYMMQFGLTSFGTLVAGLLAEGIGVQWSLGGFAVVLTLLTVLVLVFTPRLRNLD